MVVSPGQLQAQRCLDGARCTMTDFGTRGCWMLQGNSQFRVSGKKKKKKKMRKFAS